MRQSNGRSPIIARRAAMYAAAGAVMLTVMLAPRGLLEGAPQQPVWKGIWEPVNYKGDVQFKDVLFVTADKGWVSGTGKPASGGVIMHTKDGGKTWTTQYGDPESSDRAIDQLFFLDERRGWARQGTSLLRTTDGETWEAAGTVSGYGRGFVFVSPTVGIMAEGQELKRTEDGGQTWTTTGKCGAPVVVEGLTKNETCNVGAIHFPSRNVGYAIGSGFEKAIYQMKTTDGGRSWTNSAIPSTHSGEWAFFTDERRGVIGRYSGTILGTEDGGNTWRLMPGLARSKIKFADPVVGWAMSFKYMSYTTNGGRSWTTREIPFPAMVTAVSLPRRDRGYAVGGHGMIYRYSVVPASQQVANALPAPLMPTFETLLDEKVEALDDFVESLEQSVASTPDDAGGNSNTAGSSGGTASETSSSGAGTSDNSGSTDAASGSDEAIFSESTDASTSASGSIGGTSESSAATPTSPFVEKCCGKSVSRWYLAMQAAETILPQFVAQFKNTNLLGAGLRMLVVLPARVNAASAAFSTFKRSKSKDDAKANVTQLQAAVDALKQGVSSALQKEVPST